MQKAHIRLVDTTIWPLYGALTAASAALLIPSNAYAFEQLKNGFDNLTKMYLIPLSGIVAGTALIFYIILSYFKKDEYQKNIGNIFALAILARAGLGIINALMTSFS